MQKLVIGSVVAAAVMFIFGFVFFGSPLFQFAHADAPLETQTAIQSALKALPGDGTYFIPFGETPEATAAHEAGPTAVVKYNGSGAPMMDPMVFAAGFVHMIVSAFTLGLVLWAVRDRVTDLGSRMRVVLWLSLAMVVYTRLGEPIWYRSDWQNAIYVAIAEFISFAAAGYILARWFVPAGVNATTVAAMPAAAE